MLFWVLFQARHMEGVGNKAPVDSGMAFQLGFERLDGFLVGLPVLSAVNRAL